MFVYSDMLQNIDDKNHEKHEIQKSPMNFFTKLFKWKRLCLKNKNRHCSSTCNEKIFEKGNHKIKF